MMDKQLVLDKVKIHLLTQNATSKDSGGFCLYRGPLGRMCGIGCIILDEFYDPKIEGKGLIGEHPILIGAIEKSLGCKTNQLDRDFLCEIQCIHDNNSPDIWKYLLQSLAKKYNLEFNT